MHSLHSLHCLLPSISKRARRGLTPSNFPHWHSAVPGGIAQAKTLKSCTSSHKHCHYTELPAMCVRRAASASDLGTHWWCRMRCHLLACAPCYPWQHSASRHEFKVRASTHIFFCSSTTSLHDESKVLHTCVHGFPGPFQARLSPLPLCSETSTVTATAQSRRMRYGEARVGILPRFIPGEGCPTAEGVV